jgi:hypothetical protein
MPSGSPRSTIEKRITVIVSPVSLKPLGQLPLNPALIEHARQRRMSVDNRIADRITEFSGSMRFVYLHII